MPYYEPHSASRTGFAFGRVFALTSTVFVLSACDLLEVENPTNLLDEDLTNSQLEETLSNTAEGNLSGPISFAMRYGTLLSDQYWHPSLTLQGLNVDRGYRDRANDLIENMYIDLAAGRWIADDMVTRLQSMVDNPGSHMGVARSYFYGAEGRMQLASYFREVTYDAGPPLAPADVVADAIDRYQQSAQVAAAAGDNHLQAASLGGAARAYRSLYYEPIALGGSGNAADFQQAESMARQALSIDSDYRWEAPFGSPGPGNHMAAHGRERMTPWYANRIDPVSGERDPRITHDEGSVSPDGEVLYRDKKYPLNDDTPLPLSRAAEAELIIAEARFVAGDMSGAVEFINMVRARSALPPFSSADSDEIWDQLMYERDTELWLEGRRWEDMRYYNIIPECPGPHTAPTVEECGGSALWDDVNKQEGVAKRFPVAVQESGNNTNYGGG
jgi:hypothetical protein